MRIISIDARMINNSGIGVYLKNLVRSLAGNYELVLLGNPAEIKKSFDGNNFRIIESHCPIYSIAEQAELPMRIPSCDLFISPHYNIPLLPVKAKRRMVIIHDVNHLAFYDNLSLPEKIYSKVMINRALRQSDIVLTVSEFSKSEIVKYTSADSKKIRVLYFGIDHERLTSLSQIAPLDEIKRKYNLPDKYFLFVGNVKPHKNLSGLLEALNILCREGSDYNLVVVGKKEGFINNDKKVFDLVNKDSSLSKHVFFTGYIDNEELPAIYKAASAFIFPSLYEGFGIPPLEAMVCDCPVGASDIASIPEICGDAVLYFDPYSPEDIAGKIKMLYEDKDLRNDLTSRGKARVERFSFTNFSNNLNDIMRTIN